MAVAELKMSVEAPGDEAPRAVPVQERNERRASQRQRLGPGVDTKGDSEPSHSLLDKAANIFTKNALHRIEWKDRPLRLRGLIRP